MANIDTSNISFEFPNVFQKSKNVIIRVASVTNINIDKNKIETSNGIFNCRYFVFANGAKTKYFENNAIGKNAFPMYSTFEEVQIRNTLNQHFEDALTANNTNYKKLLSIVIVDGETTEVFLSGELAEMITEKLPLKYPELNFSEMKIYLLVGPSKLLS